MKKNILLIVLGIVTVFCIIFGTIRHFGKFENNLKDALANISIEMDDDDFDDLDFDEEEDSADENKKSFAQKLSAFTSIDIDAGILELDIKEGDDFSIKAAYSKDILKPEFKVENGLLKVEQSRHKRKINMGKNVAYLVITIPEGTELKECKIDINVGELKINSLTGNIFSADMNVGEIHMNDIDFKEIDVENNVGEISISPALDISEYNLDLSSDVGEVRVEGQNKKRSYSCRGNSNKKISVKTNVGEVIIR